MLPHVGALIGWRYRRIAYGAAMIVRTWAGRGRRPLPAQWREFAGISP